MLSECFWDSGRRSISCVFQALPLPHYPAPPNRSYGAAYMDQYAQPFHQTSPHSPKLWPQERFEPGHQFGNSQPPRLNPSRGPNHQTDSNNDHDASIDCPLGIAGHITAWQDINSLQEKRSSRQDEQYTEDVQKYFHLCLPLLFV